MYSVETYQFLTYERQRELLDLAKRNHLGAACEAAHRQRASALRSLGRLLNTFLAGHGLGSGVRRRGEPRGLTDGVDTWLSIGIP